MSPANPATIATSNGRPKALIFDLDGLFADTQTIWKRAQQHLFARYGQPYGPDQETALLGISREAVSIALTEYLNRPAEEANSLYQQLHELVAEEIGRGVEPMPGALELAQAAKQAEMLIGLASNGQPDLVDATLQNIGAAGLFDAIVTAHDVSSPKPAPDVYTEASRRLGASPAASVALEDSPTGVQAALAARLRVVMVPSPGAPHIAGTMLVVPSLDDPQLWNAIGLDGGPAACGTSLGGGPMPQRRNRLKESRKQSEIG